MPEAEVVRLAPEVELVARKELNEDPRRAGKDIKILREMVQAVPDFNPRTDDAFLLRFLRCRKFDTSRAFGVLKHYYRQRAHYPTLYSELYPSTELRTFDLNLQTVLPDRDSTGASVFIFKGGLWNPKKMPSAHVFRANVLCLEQAILDPVTQVTGIVAVMDMNGFGLTHLRYCPPNHLKKVVALIQDCFPARFKAIHFVNEPAIFSVLFGLVRPFLSQKLQNRIHFHGSDYESLYDYLPPSILPEEYGGDRGPMDNSSFVKRLLENDALFKSDAKYGFFNKTEVRNVEACDFDTL